MAVNIDRRRTKQNYVNHGQYPNGPSPDTDDGLKFSRQPEMPSYVQDPVLNVTYAVGQFLGKGGFAWCYEVKDISDQSYYALKVVPKTSTVKDHRSKVLREIAIHYPLHHDNVVRLYSAFEDDDNIYMVLELCPNASLVHVMKLQKVLTEQQARRYIHQLLLGVHYLHDEAQVLHRDLKLGNMLLSKMDEVKIADFGLAAEMNTDNIDLIGQICGTPNYIAPEILRKEGHSVASEVWSIGCILYAMLFGKPPFETASVKLTYNMILEGQYSYPVSGQWISHYARDLIQSMLHPLPNCRPTIAQILHHPFFTADLKVPPHLPVKRLDQYGGGTADQVKDHVHVSPRHNAASNPKLDAVVKLMHMKRSGGVPLSLLVTDPRSNNVSPDSGFNSVVCAIDSVGNASFGPLKEAKLTWWMRAYFDAISDIVKQGASTGEVPQAFTNSQNNLIYVTKWIDYSNRYGFGCQYNNGGVSIMQNDGTRLCLSPDRHYCRRWRGSLDGAPTSWPSDIFDMANVDKMVSEESANMLRHFVRYMDSNLVAGGISDAPVVVTSPAVPFVVMWRRFTDCIVVVLSDGTFQVNFFEHHTKVALSRVIDGNNSPSLVLTFINLSRIARSYLLTSAVKDVVEMAVLERIRELLSSYILPPALAYSADL